MTPAQLDITLNGAFVYRNLDGSLYASFDYALQKFGVAVVRRTGPLSEADMQMTGADYLAAQNAILAAKAP